MVVQVDAQPGGEDFGGGLGVVQEFGEGNPGGGADFAGVGGDYESAGGLGGENVDDFVFDHVGGGEGGNGRAVFDLADGGEGQVLQAEFFGEAAVGAGYRGFVPMRVGAAGVRPEAGGVVF